MKDHIGVVREHLDQAELLTQLAEEASELAQAALKLRRVYTGINPTPMTGREAFHNLIEELADVYNCVHLLDLDTSANLDEVQRIVLIKQARWAARLTEGASV